jgi:hypothetical protein
LYPEPEVSLPSASLTEPLLDAQRHIGRVCSSNYCRKKYFMYRYTLSANAPARGTMPLPRDGRTAIRDFPVAFEDHVRPNLRVQRTLHEIALTGHAPPGVAHGLRSGDDLAAVVGSITRSDKVNHLYLLEQRTLRSPDRESNHY